MIPSCREINLKTDRTNFGRYRAIIAIFFLIFFSKENLSLTSGNLCFFIHDGNVPNIEALIYGILESKKDKSKAYSETIYHLKVNMQVGTFVNVLINKLKEMKILLQIKLFFRFPSLTVFTARGNLKDSAYTLIQLYV